MGRPPTTLEANQRLDVPAASAPVADALPATVIRPAGGWQPVDVGELWRFRELVFFLAWRDVKIRYKQTLLGAAWAVLQPAMMMVVFSLFFHRLGRLQSGDVAYPLFVFSGLLPWTFFATAVTSAANSVVGSERIITKVYFPRLAVPLAAVGPALVDFCVALVLLAGLMAYYRTPPGPGLLLAPLVLGVLLLAAAGIGTLLAALNVVYRDIRHVVPFFVQVWMFATPAVYMQVEGTGGGWMHTLLSLNPLTPLVSAFRACVLGGPIPVGPLAAAAGIMLVVFLGACLYFRKVEDSFADVI